MKKIFLGVYLLFCLSLWSCSHNPIDSFNKISVGDDKEAVLEKAGSPLRSRFKEGRDIWTYRFVVQSGYDYKDVIFVNQKVTEVRISPEIDYKEIERKENLVEEDLVSQKNRKKVEKEQKPIKPKMDDSVLDQKSVPKKDSFVPVE